MCNKIKIFKQLKATGDSIYDNIIKTFSTYISIINFRFLNILFHVIGTNYFTKYE